jgi:hypothetical protein
MSPIARLLRVNPSRSPGIFTTGTLSLELRSGRQLFKERICDGNVIVPMHHVAAFQELRACTHGNRGYGITHAEMCAAANTVEATYLLLELRHSW